MLEVKYVTQAHIYGIVVKRVPGELGYKTKIYYSVIRIRHKLKLVYIYACLGRS